MQTPGTQPGLLPWSNSIRLSMANDPGRQLFHDQVNTHGFLFLQQYLDNILSGAKQEYASLEFSYFLLTFALVP